MAYDLIYPGQTIDQLLTTAYYLKNAGYIFLGSASSYSGTPSQRAWLIAPSGFTGFGFSEAIPIGSMGICLFNGTSWSGVTINVVTVDDTMRAGSDNPISSGAVYDVLSTITQGISAQLDSLELADATAPSDILDVLTVALKMTKGGFDVVVSSLDILSATASKAGLMSAADKIKLDGFVNNIRSLVFADTTPSSDLGTKIVESLKWTVDNVQEVITTLTILAASTEKAGLMSAVDKEYVDGLPTTLGTMTSALQDMMASILSIVFDDTTPSSDKANKIVETMKWTSGGIQRAITTLTILSATASKAGLMSAADKAYVDGLPATLTSLSNSISSIETALLNYYTKEQTYSMTEVDTLLDGKQNVIDDLASIRSGAAAGATAVQPADMNSAISSVRASIGYYECSTAAGTAAKTVSASGYTLTNGGCIRIKMTNANTADNATLNINGTGAKALFYDGAQASSANTWEAGEVLEVYYDGSQYQCASGGGGKFSTGQKVKETGITDEVEQDSTALVTSGGVYDLVDSVVGISVDVDISGLTQQECALGTTTWYLQQTYKTQKHIALPVMSGQKYYIKATSVSALAAYALVTSSYSPPYNNGDVIPFVSSEEERYVCDVGVEVLVDVPSDAAFLILTTVDGSGSGNAISWQVKLASNVREQINAIESTVYEHADILSNCYHRAQGGTEVKTITSSDLQNGTQAGGTSNVRVTTKMDSLIDVMDVLRVTLAITSSSVSGAVDRATITFYDSTKTYLNALDLGWKYFTGGSDVVFDIDLTLPLYDNVAYVGVYFGSNNTNISPSLIDTSGITFTLIMPSVRITKAVDTEMLDNKLNERKATDLLRGDINVIAHLGGGTFGGAVAPYNSMWSAIIAGKTGMKVCEFDIVFTSDDVPICCHDLTLKGSNNEFVRKDGTTIPSATPIGNITYATMMSDYEYRQGYAPYKEISTLDDVLRVYRDYNIIPVIEIKNPATEMNATRYNIILDAVKKYIGIRNCMLAMFDITNAITLRGMSSELLIAISGNNASAVPNLIANAKEYNFICGLISSAITQEIVQQFVTNDITLYAWTIQDDFNAMLALGVRNFICNDTADISFTGGVQNTYISNALDFSNITHTGTVTDGHLVLASGQTATLTSEVTSWLNAIKLNLCIKGTCTINANGITYNVANDGFNDYMILLRQHDKSSVTVTINGSCEIASLAFETKSY